MVKSIYKSQVNAYLRIYSCLDGALGRPDDDNRKPFSIHTFVPPALVL